MNEGFDPAKHIPVTVDNMPAEEVGEAHEREDIPVPIPWAKTAVVRHRKTKQMAVVHRVDHITRQLRLWYPDREHLPVKDQFDRRTEWHTFDDWEPEIMLSTEEIERQKAKELFAQELEAFDATGLEFVMVFCDDPDPVKALAKLRALKKQNLVRTKDAVMPEEPAKKGGK